MIGGYTDMHVHTVPRDGAVALGGWRRLLQPLLATLAGTRGNGPPAARGYMERLANRLRSAREVRRAVLLAMDHGYDEYGRRSQAMGGYAASNEDVLAWCRENPGLFLFGASVHPHRHDALDALDQAAAQGAVLVKLLPNSQGIDLSAPRHLAYFRKLTDLGLPLLCHTGAEFMLPAIRQSWGDLARLRPALESGVTVIAAHGGSSGWFYNHHTLHRYAELLAAHPNLYGDTAALGMASRMGALLWWRKHGEYFDKLLFATDYPVPVTPAAWRPWMSAEDHRRLRRESNPFDRMALLLEILDIQPPRQGFEQLLVKSGRWSAEQAER